MIEWILSLYDSMIVIGFFLFAAALLAVIIWGTIESVKAARKDGKE